ncbi:hypothetical protein SALB1_0096 [Salinisphaera sp. LB1]|nr:hypothetical protein SALB1_0096 [Salinisphaera sp. LB1]
MVSAACHHATSTGGGPNAAALPHIWQGRNAAEPKPVAADH